MPKCPLGFLSAMLMLATAIANAHSLRGESEQSNRERKPRHLKTIELDREDGATLLKVDCSNDGRKALIVMGPSQAPVIPSNIRVRASILFIEAGAMLTTPVDDSHRSIEAALGADGMTYDVRQFARNGRTPDRIDTRSTSDGALIRTANVDNPGGSSHFSGGKWILVSPANEISLLCGGRKEPATYAYPSPLTGCVLTSRALLVTLNAHQQCMIRNLATKQVTTTFKCKSDCDALLDATLDGQFVAFGKSNELIIRDVPRNNFIVLSRPGNDVGYETAKFIPGTSVLAYYHAAHKSVAFLDCNMSREEPGIGDLEPSLIGFSANGRYLIVGRNDASRVYLYDVGSFHPPSLEPLR